MASERELIVCLGYGDESPIYVRARALWQFYASHFPQINFLFAKESSTLRHGEVHYNGHDVLVGIDPGFGGPTADGSPGVGSNRDNQRSVFRQVAVYDYLLRSRHKPFYVYQSTITSVVDFRGVLAMLAQMPDRACYAGMPGRMTSPPDLEGLTFACGTNGIFSSDLIVVMSSRYVPGHPYADLPQDIWQAVVLHDVDRIALPFFTFQLPRTPGENDSKIAEMTGRLIQMGHYHFRIKSEGGSQPREDTDPWVMLEVMKAVLASPAPGDYLQLQTALISSLATKNGQTMSAYGEDNFFTGERRFPLSDIEAEMVFPDLRKSS